MKILFQGDSITDAGRSRVMPRYLGKGYVSYIAYNLMQEGYRHEIRNTGFGGNRICDIYARWEEDTLNIDFDMLSFMCGINDIGFQIREGKGINPSKWKFIYDRMLYEVMEKNPAAKLILMEPFILKRDLEDVDMSNQNDIFLNYDLWRSQIDERGEIAKELADKYHAVFVPLGKVFDRKCQEVGVDKWTVDCIHPTPAGHKVIAEEWLKACKHLL